MEQAAPRGSTNRALFQDFTTFAPFWRSPILNSLPILKMKNTAIASAHTAGPWHVDRQSPYSAICIKPYPGRIVCDIAGTDQEAEANALLIAAAPELLEVCKYIVQLTEVDHWENDALAMMNRTGVPVLKEAIAAATIADAERSNAPHFEE